MKVSESMTREVVTVAPDASLATAAALMRGSDVGPLPVCDGDVVVGVLTDRDITIRATAKGLEPRKTMVREVMTPEVVCCLEDDDVEKAAGLMQAAQLRRLLVVDDDGRLAGIVSLGDLAVRTGEDELVGQTLERVAAPPSDEPFTKEER